MPDNELWRLLKPALNAKQKFKKGNNKLARERENEFFETETASIQFLCTAMIKLRKLGPHNQTSARETPW